MVSSENQISTKNETSIQWIKYWSQLFYSEIMVFLSPVDLLTWLLHYITSTIGISFWGLISHLMTPNFCFFKCDLVRKSRKIVTLKKKQMPRYNLINFPPHHRLQILQISQSELRYIELLLLNRKGQLTRNLTGNQVSYTECHLGPLVTLANPSMLKKSLQKPVHSKAPLQSLAPLHVLVYALKQAWNCCRQKWNL